MAQLLRDHELHFLPTRVGNERVEEDDAAGPPETRDVGVQLSRSSARVRDEESHIDAPGRTRLGQRGA
jgi:hypothetical protein